MRILVIEDEQTLSDFIQRGLTEAGYIVDAAYDGEQGQNFAEIFPYDLIILDIILPKKDGVSLCAGLRSKKNSSRILILSSRDSVTDRIKGLDAGADDYLVKPFAFDELLARIRALMRRETGKATKLLESGDLCINTLTKEVKQGQEIIRLTSREYSLLEYFMINPDILITHRMIEDYVWHGSLETESNLIEVYINRLRTKLDKDGKSLITTVRGMGYRFKTS